ncbi:toxin TcdB middle/N-terminal domain-containing protein [Microbacterium sp. AZCO]|uniref:toxin TcdB middle/N-terminal domain-containing protein n=1 Tax=Microbacterium sp. AZCO TaxID=3142976 RepID=UPI0031F36E4C
MSATEQTSAPGGTGSASGAGQGFDVNLSTGTATSNYTLLLPDGVAGQKPQLSIEYNHNAGLGPFGLGWILPTRSIRSAIDHGTPTGTATDRLLDGGAEIVPLGAGLFGALREAAFSRYTRTGDGWLIEDRNGTTHELGVTEEFRVADPQHPDRPLEWLLQTTRDASGNRIDYGYTRDRGQVYLASVRYARYEVRFTYEDRPDARHDGRLGFSRWVALRASRADLVLDPGAHERVIRTWSFGYDIAPGSGVSLLTSVGLVARGDAADGSQDVTRPTVTYAYSGFDLGAFRPSIMDADGAPPPPLTDPDVALVTLDDAPLPGILSTRDGRQTYWPNRGNGRFGRPRPVPRTPLVSSFQRAGLALVDIDGSGTADLVVAATNAAQGFYRNGGRAGWDRFVAYPGTSATPSWRDRSLRLLDADGDGAIDAVAATRGGLRWWRNRGEDGWADAVLALSPDIAGVDLTSGDVHFADMTGDGAADLVRVRSGSVEYWPSLGDGRFGARVVMADAPRLPRAASEVLLVDLDGDGCADLVVLDAHGVTVALNRNGIGFASPVTRPIGPVPTAGSVRAVNMDGGPAAGLVWSTPVHRGSAYVRWSAPGIPPAYLLRSSDNGSGLVAELTYRAAVDDLIRDREADRDAAWTTNFPFPYTVVAAVVETDAVSGRRTEVQYRYHEAHFEPRTRQFQGFRKTERLTVGDDSRATVREVHTFLMAQERVPGNGPGHASLNGLLATVETYSDDGGPSAGRPYRVETTLHGLTVLDEFDDGRQRVFVRADEHRIDDSERGDDMRTERKTYTYDEVGNVVREVQTGAGILGGAPVPEMVLVRETQYARSDTRYLVDHPSRTVLRDGAGALLDEQRIHYDGADFTGLPLGQADRGLRTRQDALVLSRADFDAQYAGMDASALGYSFDADVDGTPAVFSTPSRSRYDARGLTVESLDPLGVSTRFTFDDAGLFRTGLDDAFGHSAFEYDPVTGQLLRTTLADGSTTVFRYDAQGRALASALPGEDIDDPAASYSYDETTVPHSRTTRIRLADGSHADNVAYYDGTGKEFQVRTTVTPGQVVVSSVVRRNPWGDPAEEFEPTFAAALAFAPVDTAGRPSRTFEYDGIGRVVRCVDYGGGVSTATFEAFAVETRDAVSNDSSAEAIARGRADTPHREEFDALRRVVRVAELHAGDVLEETRYTIGPAGELTAVGDGVREKFSYTYDRRGCRLSVTSVEAGVRTVWYDGRGKPVRTKDGSGHDLAADWDDAGRLLRLAEGATTLESYVYDTAAQHALGRLASVEYAGGSQRYEYDAAGRLTTRIHAFDGVAEPETLGFEYDPVGRQTAVVHTDGRRIENELTANGWLAGIHGVIDAIEHDARGLATRIAYANGVVTTTEYGPGPGSLRHRRTLSKAGAVLEDIAFDHDAGGQLIAAADAAPGGRTRDYRYDPLGQLIGSADAGGSAHSYAYTGRNLVTNDEAAVALGYTVAQGDRLTSVVAQGHPAFVVAHDLGGNLLSLPGQQYRYNAKNELIGLTTDAGVMAEYGYDHLGLRTTKSVTAADGTVSTSRFVLEHAVVEDDRRTLFVTVGALRVAVIGPDGTTWLHDGASVGTTAFVTDATGERAGTVDVLPFGTTAAQDGAVAHQTYGLHPVDLESGLVYMRRRYYAPSIGRFLTPDLLALYQPEKFLHAPASLHLYAYVANDPSDKVDVDGLSFWSFVGSVAGVVVGIVVGVLIVAAVVATGGIAGVLIGIGLAIGAGLVVTGISYIVASAVDPNSGFGQFMRGFMIGFNAGMNGVLAAAIFGPVVGVALGVINFLATFDGVAKNSVYQGILGWTSWLMPMSWAVNALGLAFYAVNLILAGVTLNKVDALKIDKLGIDWKTGSLVMVGGAIRNGTAFDMGHFVFIDPAHLKDGDPDRSYDALVAHETGHTLAFAAFGTAFGLADLIGENVVGLGADDYGEKIAESHANRPGRPTIPMWG